MQERRRSPRSKVTIDVNGKGKSTLEVSVLDLSQHGMLVESSTPVRPGGTCEITIDAPGGERRVRAEVRRCRAQMVETARGPRIAYHAGLEFTEPAAGGEEVNALLAELCTTGAASTQRRDENDTTRATSRDESDSTAFKFAM